MFAFFPAQFYFVLLYFIMMAVGAHLLNVFPPKKDIIPVDVSFSVIHLFSLTYIPTAVKLKQGSDS